MEGKGTSVAILVGVWATFALDVFGSLTSSPQTTEINARSRAETLMKWVMLAAVVAVTGGLVAAVVSKRVWPLLATIAIAGGMYGLYRHARDSGLASGAPGTEGSVQVAPAAELDDQGW